MNPTNQLKTVRIRHRRPVAPSPFASAMACFAMGFSLLVDAVWLPISTTYWRVAVHCADLLCSRRNRPRAWVHAAFAACLLYVIAFGILTFLVLKLWL